MKVILLEDVKNLGKKNTVVTVSDGYFKNFLAKKKLAVAYTEQGLKVLASDLDKIHEEFIHNVDQAKAIGKQLANIELNYQLKSHGGNVFGSVSAKEIITTLKQKHNIEITKFNFPKNFQPLKTGIHHIQLQLFTSVSATLKVVVSETK
ncbi:MAG: 50S ribosomal protein L9 [Mycoplasma sp.]